jgi:hypothetical protein
VDAGVGAGAGADAGVGAGAGAIPASPRPFDKSRLRPRFADAASAHSVVCDFERASDFSFLVGLMPYVSRLANAAFFSAHPLSAVPADAAPHVWEAGLAPDADVTKWQRRIEPVWRPMAGGCHLTRDVEAMIAAAGWRIDQAERMYLPGTPHFAGYNVWGSAQPV